MELGVAGAADRPQVRVAELVAGLSLGIDLGFGQPMEHVLRHTPTLTSRPSGSATTSLASKAIKYDHDLKSLRMAAAGMRFLGSGHPTLHRFRLGLEFMISGHREVDGMVEHHASLARTLAEQLELSDEVLEARASFRCQGRTV